MTRRNAPIYLPRMRPLPARRAVVVSVLDIGSTKVCCLIAKLSPRTDDCVLPGRTHSIEVLGYGYQRSRGLKSGVVVDMDEAEQAIRLAVDAAERMAGVTVESLITNVTCGRLNSEIITATVGLAGDEVCEADIQRVLTAGSAHTVAEGRAVMHALPIAYTLDGNRGMRDPRGMLGERLGVDLQVVTAEIAPVRNLELCINRGHLAVETMVATPVRQRPVDPRRGRDGAGCGLRRHGRWHDDHFRLRGRPDGSHGCHCRRRSSCDDGHCPRALHQAGGCRAHQDASGVGSAVAIGRA